MTPKLSVGTKIKHANGYTYAVRSQNDIDTLLYCKEARIKWVVVRNLKTIDGISRFTEEFLYDGIVATDVKWEQCHYFNKSDNAIKFMQDRYMERTGKYQCHHTRCIYCQYQDECCNYKI